VKRLHEATLFVVALSSRWTRQFQHGPAARPDRDDHAQPDEDRRLALQDPSIDDRHAERRLAGLRDAGGW
jgi:hypothetical protein